MSIVMRNIRNLSAVIVGSMITLGPVPSSAATNTSATPVAASSVDASMAADAPAAVSARRALAAVVRAKLIARHIHPGRNLDAVTAAVARAPRHLLVPQGEAPKAYADQILYIGYGQTSPILVSSPS